MNLKIQWVQTNVKLIMTVLEIELVVNGIGVREHRTVIKKTNVILMRPKTQWVQTNANQIMIVLEIELVVNGIGVKVNLIVNKLWCINI